MSTLILRTDYDEDYTYDYVTICGKYVAKRDSADVIMINNQLVLS